MKIFFRLQPRWPPCALDPESPYNNTGGHIVPLYFMKMKTTKTTKTRNNNRNKIHTNKLSLAILSLISVLGKLLRRVTVVPKHVEG